MSEESEEKGLGHLGKDVRLPSLIPVSAKGLP